MVRVPVTPKQFVLVFLFMAAIIGTLIISSSLSESEQVTKVVTEFGYVGVMIMGIIAGLNSVVPIPAAAFTPVFTAAGLTIPFIILALAAGTLVADFVSFYLGQLTKSLVTDKYPRLTTFFENLKARHHHWLPFFVLLYAAFMPLPNEIILIPLGIAGVTFGRVIIPLFIGDFIFQTYMVYGFENLTATLFG